MQLRPRLRLVVGVSEVRGGDLSSSGEFARVGDFRKAGSATLAGLPHLRSS